MTIFCDKCSKQILGKVYSCQCGELFFCSKLCYDKVIKTHKKECPAYLKKKKAQFNPPVLQATEPALQNDLIIPNSQLSGSHNQPTGSPPQANNVGHEQAEDRVVQAENDPEGNNQDGLNCARVRDKYGRWKNTMKEGDNKPEKNEEQKKRDKVSSKVSKMKKSAVKILENIQLEMPEVSQKYTFESNKYRGAKQSILFESNGSNGFQDLERVSTGIPPHQQPDASLGSVATQLRPFAGNNVAAPSSSRQRLSESLCYICKRSLGADNSKRIVCTKRDCFRAPAHLHCLNFEIPSSMLPKMRCYYMCPYHRGREQVESESDEELNETDIAPSNAFSQPSLASQRDRARKRNENITKPMKLSHLLMGVLGTPQKYLTANEVRSLMGAYMKKLLVVDKKYIPDRELSAVLGSEPFKMIQIFKLLKANKHISGS